MYLTPDAFVEKYLKDRLPYFKIYRGGTLSEKHVMDRLLEFEADTDLDARLAVGEDKLRDFFDKYPDGYVTIICKKSPKDKDEHSCTNSVKWGDKPGNGMARDNVGTVGTGFGQMKQMLEMMVLVQGMMKPQDTTALQLEMLRKQHELELAQVKKQHRWEKEKEELIGALQEEPPSIGETLAQELVALVRPIATGLLAAKGAQGQPTALPIINGMAAATKPAKPGKAPTAQPAAAAEPAPKPGTHCMMNISVDNTLVCVRYIMETVFPDYNVNEVMPALASVCAQYKDVIRQFTEPTIIANRQREAGQSRPSSVGANDEEE